MYALGPPKSFATTLSDLEQKEQRSKRRFTGRTFEMVMARSSLSNDARSLLRSRDAVKLSLTLPDTVRRWETARPDPSFPWSSASNSSPQVLGAIAAAEMPGRRRTGLADDRDHSERARAGRGTWAWPRWPLGSRAQSDGPCASGAQVVYPDRRFLDQMRLSTRVWRIVAPLVAGGFFWLALRPDVDHATSPHGLAHLLFGTGGDAGASFISHPAWLSLHIVVRKVYSIVAFAIVGFCTDKALGPVRRPMLRSALLVAAYSLCIEAGQRLVVGHEPLLERVFDVGCGAVGGVIAIRLEGAFDGRATPSPIALHVPGGAPRRAPSGRRLE
jgi:hypothetical protein